MRTYIQERRINCSKYTRMDRGEDGSRNPFLMRILNFLKEPK